MFYMKGKKYSWERDRQSYLLTEGERKMQFICYLSFVKFRFIKFRVGTKVYFKIYVSYIESWHKDSHIPTTKFITEHDSCVRSPWHVAAQPHPLPHRLRGNRCAEFTANICQAPLMSIAREERVGRSEYLSLGIQKLEKMWFQVSSPSGGETDMSTMVVVWGRMEKYFARGLNAGKAQKRDIIPAAVSRGWRQGSLSAFDGWRGFLQMEGKGRCHSQKGGRRSKVVWKMTAPSRMTKDAGGRGKKLQPGWK